MKKHLQGEIYCLVSTIAIHSTHQTGWCLDSGLSGNSAHTLNG